jgi:ribosome-binding ATPase YchF (GTP1/OBG family)
MLIDVPISGDRNGIKNEAEKILKYKYRTTEIRRMWNVKTTVIPVITGDQRLKQIAETAGSKKTICNQLEVVDIAGLVKGASTGKGLCNKFLSHIREVDAILQFFFFSLKVGRKIEML